MRQLLRRLWHALRQRRHDADLTEEIEFHLAMKRRELEAAGVRATDAATEARRQLGNLTLVREDARAVWVWPWLESVWQDMSYALRSFRRQPGFAVIACLTLALGIGANTTIFSVIDQLVLRSPSFEHLDRLVMIRENNPQVVPFDLDASPGNFLDWRAESRSFDILAAWRNWYVTFGEPSPGAPASELIRGVRVSPSFFPMLGVQPALGRAFRDDEEQPGKDRVVLLTYTFWTRRFGADDTVIGRRVLVDGAPALVIGVLPPDFQFLQPDLDIWMPLTVDAAFHDRVSHSVWALARLAPGISLASAQAEMDGIAARLGETFPDTNAGWHPSVQPFYPPVEIRALTPALWVLFGAAGLVLLIACANVANLLVARALARQKEVAIRAALGAGRGRLLRQMLTESVVLATVGSALGALVAYKGIDLLVPLLPHAGTNIGPSAFRSIAPDVDGRMLAFSLTIAILTSVVFGLLPALQTTRPPSLRLCGAQASRRPGRVFLMVQLALSIVLLIGAGLLLESFWRLQRVNPGFQADHLLTMSIWVPKEKYPRAADVRAFYEDAIGRISGLPGVRGASAISYRPFLSMGTGERVEIEGRPASDPHAPAAVAYRVIAPGFTRVLGQPLLTGREFTAHDDAEAEGAAIVNETMASRFWPGTSAIGHRLRLAFHRSNVPWELDAEPRWLTVVGVARDVKGLEPPERDQSEVYVSSLQFPLAYMFLVVRTVTPPALLATSIQAQLRAIDPDQPVADIRTMDDAIAASVPRFNVGLLGAFAFVALVLSGVGVYGVTSYAVSRRTQEIGVRMALGAHAGQVRTMILRESLSMGLASVTVGVIVALGLTRAMAGLLYGVTATDAPTYAVASGTLLGVALLAALVPARRATKVDPLVALRTE